MPHPPGSTEQIQYSRNQPALDPVKHQNIVLGIFLLAFCLSSLS